MKQIPQPEIIDCLARCLAWSHYEKPMTLDDIRAFICSLAIEEPDPKLAIILYKKYRQAINETARALAKKIV
jgi:hypothetical protein